MSAFPQSSRSNGVNQSILSGRLRPEAHIGISVTVGHSRLSEAQESEIGFSVLCYTELVLYYTITPINLSNRL